MTTAYDGIHVLLRETSRSCATRRMSTMPSAQPSTHTPREARPVLITALPSGILVLASSLSLTRGKHTEGDSHLVSASAAFPVGLAAGCGRPVGTQP
jgi:hypothetical protein